MKITGRSEMAIAPNTIFVLKRAPSCSRLRSVKSRTMLRVRISPKTSSAAVIKLETAYRAMTARHELGSIGTSSEPSMNTAASRSVTRMPPTAKRVRVFDVDGLIGFPSRSQAEIFATRNGCNELHAPGSTPCRCERSKRDIHCRAPGLGAGFARTSAESPRRFPSRLPDCAAPGSALYRHPRQTRGDYRRRAELNRRSPGQSRGSRGVVRAGLGLVFGTSCRVNLDNCCEGSAQTP